MRLAAILLMLLLAGIARSGDDDDDDTDPDLPALSQHLRSIDENLQREADHPETMGEDGDAGDKPDTDATGGMGDVRPGGEHTAEPSPNLDGSEVTTPVPGPDAGASPDARAARRRRQRGRAQAGDRREADCRRTEGRGRTGAEPGRRGASRPRSPEPDGNEPAPESPAGPPGDSAPAGGRRSLKRCGLSPRRPRATRKMRAWTTRETCSRDVCVPDCC